MSNATVPATQILVGDKQIHYRIYRIRSTMVVASIDSIRISCNGGQMQVIANVIECKMSLLN